MPEGNRQHDGALALAAVEPGCITSAKAKRRGDLRPPGEPACRAVSLDQEALEMQGDRLHTAPAVLGLGVGIVVRVRVDVVGVCATLRVGNELDARDADVVRGQEGLPGRNEGVIEAWHDLELVTRRDSRTGLTWLLDLTGIGRAKLETLGSVDFGRRTTTDRQ